MIALVQTRRGGCRMNAVTPEADARAPRRSIRPASSSCPQVGHGRALGIEFRGSGEDWAELALPWNASLVGVPESGILASGALSA
jgi:hypothetical protein